MALAGVVFHAMGREDLVVLVRRAVLVRLVGLRVALRAVARLVTRLVLFLVLVAEARVALRTVFRRALLALFVRRAVVVAMIGAPEVGRGRPAYMWEWPTGFSLGSRRHNEADAGGDGPVAG